MLRLATLSLLLTAPVLAQTTWTSFEDRKGHAIASDSAGGVLMFGGESSTSTGDYRDDTYAFANAGPTASWTQLNPSRSPAARTEHAMAAGVSTDDASIFILFGGLAVPTGTMGPAVPNGETFIYDGSGWGNGVLHAAGPSARTGHAMITDTRRNRIVLFGGFSGGFAVNDLWEYDPTNEVWLQPTVTGTTPGSRFDHATAFHPGNGPNDGRVYLFGGTPFRNDMWEYDPWTSSWTDVTPATKPSVRRRAAMAYLPAFDNIVLFAGQPNTLAAQNDTWVWDRYGGTTGTWTQHSPGNTPPARWDHAMAPDQLGNHVVLLGGDDGSGNTLSGTWFWNGVTWIEELPPPSPRSGVAMAYDGGRDRHPMFGGRTVPGGSNLDETWELDGPNWRERSPSTKPSPRADAGLAHDAARNKTVLYGGRSGGSCGTELGDTWEWDGSNWSPRALSNNPPAAGGVQPVFDSTRNVIWMLVGSEMWRYDGASWTTTKPTGRYLFAHAFDSNRNRWVVFGGNNGNNTYSSDTWEWDGNNWIPRLPASPPGSRFNAMMAYDVSRSLSVLCGGRASSQYSDTWTWDGNNWTQLSTSTLQLSGAAVAYNAGTSEAQVICGFFGGANQTSMWGWTGTWQSRPTGPSARNEPTMAWFPPSSALVLHGGQAGGSALSDTWTFQNGSWSAPNPNNPPPALYGSGMAYHAATGRLVLFGGASAPSGGGQSNETWTWDGQDWQQEGSTPIPPARYGAGMFDDGARTFLWGGNGLTGPLSDMWAWDGQNWSLVAAGADIVGRTNYGAAYDARRDRVVVFGGREDCSSGSYLNDTWEWDGRGWLQRSSTVSPSPRERCRLTYDEARGRVVLFGGSDGSSTFGDTWEWDGDEWTARAPVNSPTANSGHGLTFDQQRQITVTFGSTGTWDYGPTSPANIEAFGSGCPGSNGTPSLEPKPWAGPWLGGQLEVDIINQPPGLGLFVWGYSETVWAGGPLPFPLAPFGGGAGCNLLVQDTIVQVFLSGTNPYVSFVLPNHPSFLGKVMRAQAGFLDIGLGGAPVVTHALRMTFGSK